jgi:hypothetical protein
MLENHGKLKLKKNNQPKKKKTQEAGIFPTPWRDVLRGG